MRPEGEMQIKNSADGRLTASSDKPVSIDLGTIEAVGIKNLVDIESHNITRIAGVTSHFIKLFGGGEIVLAFNEQGTILDCRGSNVLTTIENGRSLVFSKKKLN